jgi:hypothetical protein
MAYMSFIKNSFEFIEYFQAIKIIPKYGIKASNCKLQVVGFLTMFLQLKAHKA